MKTSDMRLHQTAAFIASQLSFQGITDTQLEELARVAVSHGLGPMFYQTAKQAGIEESLIQSAKDATQKTAIHTAILTKTLTDVNTALSQTNIPAIWLKGAALSQTVYPLPYLRPMNDLDVLVPYAQREVALHLVQTLGYQFVDKQVLFGSHDKITERLSHHYHLTGGAGRYVTLELHYQLLGNTEQLLTIDQLTWFWGQIQPITGEITFATLKPEAHLLFLCAHALLQHGEVDFYLQRFFDMHLLVTKSTLDWGLLTAQADVLGWSAAVLRGFELANQYFATPVPKAVTNQLKQQSQNTRRLVMMQGTGSRWEKAVGNLASLPGEGKIRFLCQLLLPPPDYMRSRYDVPSKHWIFPYYLYRWGSQVWGLFAWIWHWLILKTKK